MASVFDGVPALQGVDMRLGLAALMEGLQQRFKNQQDTQERNLLSQIGQTSVNDPEAARLMAFAAGKPELGLKIHELDLNGKKQFAETVQRYTLLADTPEKWEALRGKLSEITGEDPGDFQTGRTDLLGEFGDLDTILSENERTGDNVREEERLRIEQERLRIAQDDAAAGGKPPAGYEKGPDGVLRFVVGGPADPAVIAEQATARAKAGAAKPTDREARNAQLYKVVSPEMKIVEDNFGSLSNFLNQTGATLGGNALVSSGYQRARNGVRTIVASYLYSVSGATANPGEVETQTDILMPKVGDGKPAVKDKLDRIKVMVDSIKPGSGGALIAGPEAPAEPLDENAPPQSFIDAEQDPELWRFMTDEGRAAWQ